MEKKRPKTANRQKRLVRPGKKKPQTPDERLLQIRNELKVEIESTMDLLILAGGYASEGLIHEPIDILRRNVGASLLRLADLADRIVEAG